VLGKLGAVLHRLGRASEAEANYRRAITMGESLLGRTDRPNSARIALAELREALATLLLDRGQHDEALALLDTEAADLRSLALNDQISPNTAQALAEHFANLNDIFNRIGETTRSEEMAAWAFKIQSRPYRDFPGPRPPPDARP
jgi:tetratricopeptide (TPR) repeat protein